MFVSFKHSYLKYRGGSQIALKIIRNLEKYREAAKLEISVLREISEKDPRNKQWVVSELDIFGMMFLFSLSYTFHLFVFHQPLCADAWLV